MGLTNQMLDDQNAEIVKLRKAIQAVIEWESLGNHIDEDILDQLKEAIK